MISLSANQLSENVSTHTHKKKTLSNNPFQHKHVIKVIKIKIDKPKQKKTKSESFKKGKKKTQYDSHLHYQHQQQSDSTLWLQQTTREKKANDFDECEWGCFLMTQFLPPPHTRTLGDVLGGVTSGCHNHNHHRRMAFGNMEK
ncbi:hypothetical protein CDAR_240541 [Caerostris darwini]|uniref:Uncharacterized protein n=1 Tax=Caerostris darwini TaxID=1538125 RepID=A0AAV4PP54_9ARAC|nr:hypothetical protein CDAR_240541 [Caerostris darwini]